MSIFNENISIKIKDVCFMSWEKSHVDVAPRSVHAFVYREKGSASFVCNGKTAQTKPGDVFYMPAGASYSADYTEYNEVYVFHFESDAVSTMENITPSGLEAAGHLFKKAAEIWQAKKEGYYFAVISLFGEICQKFSVSWSNRQTDRYPASFTDSCEYMEREFTSPEVSVGTLASMAHMSGTYFRRLFMEKYKVTPLKYISSLRLNYAERLLSGGKYSVEEVAAMSGFNDAKYFSRLIKKQYGAPPSRLYKFG